MITDKLKSIITDMPKNKRTIIIISLTPLILILILVIIAVVAIKPTSTLYSIVGPRNSPICNGDEIVLGQFQDRNQFMNLYITHSLYRNFGQYTIYASCFDHSGLGIESAASIKIYKPDGAIDESTMTEKAIGFHEYENTISESGTYNVIVNCTKSLDWVVDYDSFYVEDWMVEAINDPSYWPLDDAQDWTSKLMEYRGQKTDTCLNIDLDTVSDISQGSNWELSISVYDDYGTRLTGSEVECMLQSNFWGVEYLDYNALSENFNYHKFINQSGLLEYNVTCEEIGHDSQNVC